MVVLLDGEVQRAQLQAFVVVEVEVEQEHSIYSAKLIIPIVTIHLAFLTLRCDAATEVVDHSVGELFLRGILHLDKKFSVIFRSAQEVIDDTSLTLAVGQLFLVKEGDLLDGRLWLDQVVEETNHDLLNTKDLLESEIAHRVDVQDFCKVIQIF